MVRSQVSVYYSNYNSDNVVSYLHFIFFFFFCDDSFFRIFFKILFFFSFNISSFVKGLDFKMVYFFVCSAYFLLLKEDNKIQNSNPIMYLHHYVFFYYFLFFLNNFENIRIWNELSTKDFYFIYLLTQLSDYGLT